MFLNYKLLSLKHASYIIPIEVPHVIFFVKLEFNLLNLYDHIYEQNMFSFNLVIKGENTN